MPDISELKRYSLIAMRRFRRAMVYGLCDSAGLFYVGQTTDPKRRFDPESDRFERSDLVMARIQAAGSSFYVIVIEKMTGIYTQEILDEAEKQAIELHCLSLVNRQHNPIKWGSVLIRGAQLCSRCSEPITVRNSTYCYICLGSLLNKRGQSKQELRDLCKQIETQRKMAASSEA